jgi:hypothetical protein
MTLRFFGLGALGLAILSGIHGCGPDDDDDSGNHSSGAESGAGGTKTPAGHGGSGAADASGGSGEAGGAPSSGGSLSTGGSSADGGTGTAGRTNRGGTGGTRAGSGGTHTGSGGSDDGAGGSENGTGGSMSEGGASGEAGSDAGGAPNGGAPWSNGGSTTAHGGATSSNGGAAANGGAATGGQGGLGGAAGAPPCVDTVNLPPLTSPPATLDLTGLYTSPDALPTDTAPYVQEYTPTYTLWSDGANKKRWVYLPPCTQIDTSDMDHWVFPVGTRFWKEFRVGDKLVETRFIHRFGTGPSDWLIVTYQWDPNVASPSAGNAFYLQHGLHDANGTTHDIPDQADCPLCHGHLPEHVLGFSAFELTGSPGAIDIGVLSQQGLLTHPAPNGFTPPGTSVQQAGLGYLHANCGMCHNEYFDATTDDPPRMRLLTGETTLETTDTYRTLVKHLTQNTDFTGVYRIKPGDHTNSEIYQRMSLRPGLTNDANPNAAGGDQMPPVATEVPDADGMNAVAAFIDSLPADAPAGR